MEGSSYRPVRIWGQRHGIGPAAVSTHSSPSPRATICSDPPSTSTAAARRKHGTFLRGEIPDREMVIWPGAQDWQESASPHVVTRNCLFAGRKS